MKKLRIEDIQVDSYETTHAIEPAHGTVRANMATTLCATAAPRCQPTFGSSCVSAPWCC